MCRAATCNTYAHWQGTSCFSDKRRSSRDVGWWQAWQGPQRGQAKRKATFTPTPQLPVFSGAPLCTSLFPLTQPCLASCPDIHAHRSAGCPFPGPTPIQTNYLLCCLHSRYIIIDAIVFKTLDCLGEKSVSSLGSGGKITFLTLGPWEYWFWITTPFSGINRVVSSRTACNVKRKVTLDGHSQRDSFTSQL